MSFHIYYIYDCTFAGFLTAVHLAFQDKPKDFSIIKEGTFMSQDLFGDYRKVSTHQETADNISHRIVSGISKNSLKSIYYAFLSEIPGIETLIFSYIHAGLIKGSKIEEMLSNMTVQQINSASKKVSRERHRMLGFLRFKKLNSGIYYGPMEPEHDVISLIAPHFTKRLGDQPWLIHDIKREKCALYNKEELIFTTEDFPTDKIIEDIEEKKFQNLWKKYFDKVTIEERKNLKLQQQFLPKKYWKYLTEKEG